MHCHRNLVTVTGVNDAPTFAASVSNLAGAITEQTGLTGSAASDSASGVLGFADVDLADTHSLKVASVIASGITSGLPANPAVLSWLRAVTITEQSGTTPGTAAWSFAAADKSFDYLAAGQVLTLTYGLTLADNHGGSFQPERGDYRDRHQRCSHHRGRDDSDGGADRTGPM